ncbi:MAG: ATP synthase F1 subunit delta [Nitrospirota bacterium]
MNKTYVAKKFSRALINTVDISAVPGVIEELKVFSGLIDADRRFKLLFASQIFSEDEKKKALDQILSHMKASPQGAKFLTLIITQGVVSAIKEIVSASLSIYEGKIGKVTAEVSSPVALDENYSNRLKAALRAMTNKEVEIESSLDPSLIGGFIVKVGSTVYDSSLRGQLQLLKAELAR